MLRSYRDDQESSSLFIIVYNVIISHQTSNRQGMVHQKMKILIWLACRAVLFWTKLYTFVFIEERKLYVIIVNDDIIFILG